MQMSKQLLEKIADVFEEVEYGEITFFISPDKKTLDYSVKTTHKESIDKCENED